MTGMIDVIAAIIVRSAAAYKVYNLNFIALV